MKYVRHGEFYHDDELSKQISQPKPSVKKEQCGNCVFFRPEFVVQGDCRRYPPTREKIPWSVRDESGKLQHHFRMGPLVCTSDWCGEYREKGD